MQNKSWRTIRTLILAGGSLLGSTPGRAQTAARSPNDRLAALERELSRLAAAAGAVVGVAVEHLETGRKVSLNPDVRFHLASAAKVPIAVHILSMVDQGRLRLDSLIRLDTWDVYPRTYGPISGYLRPGSALTVHNLLELMLIISDNNATDILLRLGGGPQAVTERMRALGLSEIRIDRTSSVAIANWLGRADISMENPIPPEGFGRLVAVERSAAEISSLGASFARDPRDTATPAAMGSLLREIWKREVLSAASGTLLRDIMYRCQTGPGRLKGLLPPGTRVAHKTGTIGGSTNDVGVIDLPGDAGHVVTVVLTKESTLPDGPGREVVMAQIGRAVHDYFTFARPSPSAASSSPSRAKDPPTRQ